MDCRIKKKSRRLIDTLCLGGLGLVLGLFFEGIFVDIGEWGRFVGFFISLVYFGLMNSKFREGQTIGKRLLGIKVVNSNNETISLLRSFSRYSILGIPFLLNGAQFIDDVYLTYLMYPLSLIIFGGLFSTLYLIIFNRVTRQTVHDLVTGTYVVLANRERQELGTIWKPHMAIVAAMFIVGATVPAFTSQLAESEPFKGMLITQQKLSENQLIKNVGITDATSTFSSAEGETTTTYINVRAIIKSDAISDIELARKLAAIVVESYPESLKRNFIQVNLSFGYDIGIWSKWNSHSHRFNPNELKVSFST